jgi:hypothetical protein
MDGHATIVMDKYEHSKEEASRPEIDRGPLPDLTMLDAPESCRNRHHDVGADGVAAFAGGDFKYAGIVWSNVKRFVSLDHVLYPSAQAKDVL